jgi:hypothetical protein
MILKRKHLSVKYSRYYLPKLQSVIKYDNGE